MKLEFKKLKAQVDDLNEQMRPLLPKLASARNAYMLDRSSANKQAVDLIQAKVSALHDESSRLVMEMPAASGLPLEAFEARESFASDLPAREQMSRESLTVEHVDATAYHDQFLPDAVEQLERLMPKGWLKEESREASRIGELFQSDGFLSLTRGLRLRSEISTVHRLRQAVHVALDYMEENPLYDHFSGALLIPTLARFQAQHHYLSSVGGERDERLQYLWKGPSSSVDSTFFELMTAASCVEMGRKVDFLKATDKTSPDIRCHDPFPMVIECKKQKSLSVYEAEEEEIMSKVFLMLRDLAARRGLSGTFHLTLYVETFSININEIVAAMVSQRLVPHPERNLEYSWGSVSFMPQPHVVNLPFETRTYSPNMLEYLFGWISDLPKWDGICCSVETASEAIIDRVRNPLALLWKNVSPKALKKRTWAPTNLFGDASLQVPAGEFGFIYVSYIEGARKEIADMRVEAFTQRIKEFEHSADIRIPNAVLCRLYPRALSEGQPDLIESGVRYMSALYGEPLLFERFPTTIYTPSA